MSTKNDIARAAYLGLRLGEAFPGSAPANLAEVVADALAFGSACRRWSEAYCSYPFTEAQVARKEERLEKWRRKLNDHLRRDVLAAPEEGTRFWPVVEGGRGDPRGPCAYLVLPASRGHVSVQIPL